MATTAITTNEKNDIQDFLRQPEIMAQFTELLGPSGKSYVQSVIIAASENAGLMECTPRSIFRAALRAASLELSCDPSARQAYLIPRNAKVKAVIVNGKVVEPERWEKRAVFQPHYHGLYNLAMRTNRYWVINVSPIYEGSEVYENPMTGLHVVVDDASGLMLANPALAGLRKVSDKGDRKIIGWMGYYKTVKVRGVEGSEKSVYMSVKDIEKHAAEYSDNYDPKKESSMWNPNHKNRRVMEMKTVLRALLAWADLTGKENEKLKAALAVDDDTELTEQEVGADNTDAITGEIKDIDEAFPAQEPKQISPEEAAYLAAKEVTTPRGKFVWKMSDEELKVCMASKDHPEIKQAAEAVMVWNALSKGKEAAITAELFG